MEIKKRELKVPNENGFIETPPSWLMKWGITLVFLAIFSFLFLAGFLKYPDIIKAPVLITHQNSSIAVFAKVDGQLVHLRVRNGDQIGKDNLIGIFESQSDWKQVLILDSIFSKPVSKQQLEMLFPKMANATLGPFRLFLNDLEQAIVYSKRLESSPFSKSKKLRVQDQIADLKQMNNSNENQKHFFEKEIALLEAQLVREIALKKERGLSEKEYESTQKSLLSHRREFENLQSQGFDNALQIKELEKEILELEEALENESGENSLKFDQALQNLRNAIGVWKKEYVLTAPAAGLLSFDFKREKKTFYKAGESVCQIIPDSILTLKAQVIVPFKNSGKVKVGTKANIFLDAFPSTEFGIVKASVEEISPINTGDGLEVKLVLTDGLKTTYGKIIPFQRELTGTVEMIISKKSLLDRLIEKTKAFVKNQ